VCRAQTQVLCNLAIGMLLAVAGLGIGSAIYLLMP
jgi:hypothetical protein